MVAPFQQFERIEDKSLFQGTENKNSDPVSPYLAKLHEKGWVLGYLNNQRVKKISSLLSKKIVIEGLNGLPFSITLNNVMEVIAKHYECEYHVFMIGSKASDYIDNTNFSNDIDIQIKFKKKCKIETLRQISQVVSNLFSACSGIAKWDLTKGVLRKTEINKEFERFYILKFKSITGVKYDITLMAFSTRKSLFIHDGRRILLDLLMTSQSVSEVKCIPILNPLKNQNRPKECRDERILDAVDPSTINFPGCLRLFSYYVKGWICKDLVFEKDITDSFVKQLRGDPRNNLQIVLKNDIDSHHKSSYLAAVVLTYNILTALLRHGCEEDYERICAACLAVLDSLVKEALTPDLTLVEEALLKGYPLAGIPLQSTPHQHLFCSALIQYKLDNYFLITQFESPYKPITVLPEPAPLIIVESIAPPPKKKKKAANIRQMNSPEQWIKHLGANRSGWNGDDINRLGEELANHLKNTSVHKPDLKKALQIHGLSFMKELLQTDRKGKYCLPFYCQLIEKKYSTQLDKKSRNNILDKCYRWIEERNADPYYIQKIFSHFSQKVSKEMSLWMLKAFIEMKDFQEAKKIAQQMPNAEISSDIRLALIHGDISNPFTVIEELEKHQALLRTLPSSTSVKALIVNAFYALLKNGQISSKQMNVLLQAAVDYQIADGQFWLKLLTKAIDIQNKNAIQTFVKTISRYEFVENDLEYFNQCLKIVFNELVKKNDPFLKLFISNASYYFDATKSYSEELLKLVRQEVMHLVKIDLVTEHDYLLYFNFVSRFEVNDSDAIFFIEKYLSTPIEEQFISICDQLSKRVHVLEIDELLKLCKIIESRKSSFPEALIIEQLEMIFDKKMFGKGSSERHQLLVNWTIQCPLLNGLLQKEGVNFIKEVATTVPETTDSLDVFEPLDNIIQTDQCGPLLEYLSKALNILEMINCKNPEEILLRWETLTCRIFESALQNGKEENVLNALELFYLVFPKFDHANAIQTNFMRKAVDILMKLFYINPHSFEKCIKKFRSYLSGGQKVWTKINRRLQDQAIISKSNQKEMDINEVGKIASMYQFIAMSQFKSEMDYPVPSEEYERELQESVKTHIEQWSKFATGMIYLCKSLLETTRVNNDKKLLSFTARIIEILMLGYPVESDEPNEMQKEILSLLLHYLMHSGDLTIGSFIMQMTQTAHLHSCAMKYKYIKTYSAENYFYHYLLDLSQLCILGKTPKQYGSEQYILDYVNNKSHWSIYQLMRMYAAYLLREDFSTKKEFILPLKKALAERCTILPSQKVLMERMNRLFQMTDIYTPDKGDIFKEVMENFIDHDDISYAFRDTDYVQSTP